MPLEPTQIDTVIEEKRREFELMERVPLRIPGGGDLQAMGMESHLVELTWLVDAQLTAEQVKHIRSLAEDAGYILAGFQEIGANIGKAELLLQQLREQLSQR